MTARFSEKAALELFSRIRNNPFHGALCLRRCLESLQAFLLSAHAQYVQEVYLDDWSDLIGGKLFHALKQQWQELRAASLILHGVVAILSRTGPRLTQLHTIRVAGVYVHTRPRCTRTGVAKTFQTLEEELWIEVLRNAPNGNIRHLEGSLLLFEEISTLAWVEQKIRNIQKLRIHGDYLTASTPDPNFKALLQKLPKLSIVYFHSLDETNDEIFDDLNNLSEISLQFGACKGESLASLLRGSAHSLQRITIIGTHLRGIGFDIQDAFQGLVFPKLSYVDLEYDVFAWNPKVKYAKSFRWSYEDGQCKLNKWLDTF